MEMSDSNGGKKPVCQDRKTFFATLMVVVSY